MGVQEYIAMLLVSAMTYIIVMIGQAGWYKRNRRKKIKTYNQRKVKERHDKQTH